ncbi:MAG: hypothetical protein KUG80_08075 [Gammaproteobacteria bacterium]|nr:hypothetical protein [Gammaproteobacteria bacterium]
MTDRLSPSSGETRLPVYFSIYCLNRSSPNTQVQLVEWRTSSAEWPGIILSNRAAYRFYLVFSVLPAPDKEDAALSDLLACLAHCIDSWTKGIQ